MGPSAKKGTTIFPGGKSMSYMASWEVRSKAFDLDHVPW